MACKLSPEIKRKIKDLRGTRHSTQFLPPLIKYAGCIEKNNYRFDYPNCDCAYKCRRCKSKIKICNDCNQPLRNWEYRIKKHKKYLEEK